MSAPYGAPPQGPGPTDLHAHRPTSPYTPEAIAAAAHRPPRPPGRPWTQGPPRPDLTWRAWVPDVVLGLAVLLLGLTEILNIDWYEPGDAWDVVPIVVATAASALLARYAPGAALALVWAVCAMQVLLGLPVLVVQLSVAVVAFGTARWGSRVTVLAALLSMPGAFFAFLLAVESGLIEQVLYGDGGPSSFVSFSYGLDESWAVILFGLAAIALVAPWLAGIALRFAERARASRVSQLAAEEDAARAHVQTDQAQEIARLREDQARMARDVHDVVGHSLAVILAQAESAQFLTGEERLQETLATIATSARSSLQDVRQVLSASPPPPRTEGVDLLIEGVRSSGYDVEASEVGAPQPLPPELATVAHRVLQEMLTNAMKHGRRDSPISVERHWPDGRWETELRIEVRNMVGTQDDTGRRAGSAPSQPAEAHPYAADPAYDADATRPLHTDRGPGSGAGPGSDAGSGAGSGAPDGSGQGVDGMRRRLAAVGGRLDVRRRDEPVGSAGSGAAGSYTATAWVPVRAGSGA